MRRRRYLFAVVLSLSLLLLAVLATPYFDFYQRTGRFLPKNIIETLQSPVVVTNCYADTLQLKDGRSISVEGISNLHTNSIALSELTKRGIEATGDGRVYGLVRIHHWCGNDPVREHIVRVDLAKVLNFLKDNSLSDNEDDKSSGNVMGRFSQWGWNISEFCSYQAFEASSK